jgi:hypothetical protein
VGPQPGPDAGDSPTQQIGVVEPVTPEPADTGVTGSAPAGREVRVPHRQEQGGEQSFVPAPRVRVEVLDRVALGLPYTREDPRVARLRIHRLRALVAQRRAQVVPASRSVRGISPAT